MSYCQHDVYCPGYGLEHEAALAAVDSTKKNWLNLKDGSRVGFFEDPRPKTYRNYAKSRALPGKQRKKDRQKRRRELKSDG